MIKLLFLNILVLSVLASQDTPIPHTPEGFSLGSKDPQLHIEAFYDLLCNDCKPSWEILEPILRNEYHITTNQTLRFTVHLYPFPCHVNSFITAQGARAIAANLRDIEDMFTYFNLIFDNQEQFFTFNVMNTTMGESYQSLVDLVRKNMPQYGDVFANSLGYGNVYDIEARTSFKYACTARGVSTTPTYFANGVAINGAFDWKANDWRRFLNSGTNDIRS